MADVVKRRRPDARILFVGTKKKIEAQVVPSLGYRFKPIWISGFRRSLNAETLLFPLKVVVSLVQSFFVLRTERPSVVVGTGGYVSGPVLAMATMMGLPTLIQEQNSFPGVTTRLLASRVREVHLSFERSARFLKGVRTTFMTGNPVRATVGSISPAIGRRFFELEEGRATVLVFGGSLGAHALNNALGKCLKEIAAVGAQVIWQTGSQDFSGAKERVDREGLTDRVRVLEFIDRMEYAYGAASVAVCRSGATTIAELAVAGLPSILVPYPFAAADHQTQNAKAMTDAGASEMLKEKELAQLFPRLSLLLQKPERLEAMAGCARNMARPGATADLADSIFRLAGERNAG